MFLYLSLIDDEGDKSKFEIIYREYRQLMYYVADQILGDTKDSEDVVHDAFLKIIEHIEKISDPKCPKTRSFVVTIVERKAIDLYRQRQRRSNVSFEEAFLDKSKEAETEAVNESDRIATAIALLPDNYRELILLRYDNGFSEGEIADIVDMTPANVQKTLQRAKKKLAALLEEDD
ncbi:MAG: RNA polymerase sigma factor [Eubacterium sp.]|nr:RNA polymerase sigma factor [Eubacterium sp.]